jgi:glycosyltransferase involved in cell wall biosynthesis
MQIKYNPAYLKAYLGIPYCWIFSLLQRRVCKISDVIVAAAPVVAESLIQSYGVPANKANLIGNFVDTHNLSFENKNFSRRPMRIVFLSRLHPEKGARVLLEAVAKCVVKDKLNLKCTIYGDGPDQHKIEKFVKVSGLDSINLAGAVPRNKVAERLADGDVFVFPSLRQEGMPLVLLEAMSCGLICLASDERGPNDLVKNGFNGFLFPAGDAEALRKQINNIYTTRGLVDIAGNARQHIEKNYDRVKQLDKYYSLITQMNG